MRETYLTVAGRIRRELNGLEEVAARVIEIWGAGAGENYRIDAVALNLHGFYTGLEHIFEIIATRIDQTEPAGPHWHQELLDQMNTEIPSVRPAVLSSSARRKLDRYRGFRHVVRNVYTMTLDSHQVGQLVTALPATMEHVTSELNAFADALERIAQ